MNELTSITRQALFLVLIASGPPVAMALIVGFIVSVFQATTQIQEQTLSFAPKLIAVLGILGIGGSWIGSKLVRFTFLVFDQFPYILR